MSEDHVKEDLLRPIALFSSPAFGAAVAARCGNSPISDSAGQVAYHERRVNADDELENWVARSVSAIQSLRHDQY